MAAGEGAPLVCLQELTLSPYFAITPDGPRRPAPSPSRSPTGRRRASPRAARRARRPRARLALRARRRTTGSASTPRSSSAPDGDAGRAHAQAPHPGHRRLLRGQVLPARAAGDDGYPVVELGDARFGFPTCWDQWFPELARAYSLAGAEVIVYPTAIGSEPDHPGLRHRSRCGSG